MTRVLLPMRRAPEMQLCVDIHPECEREGCDADVSQPGEEQ